MNGNRSAVTATAAARSLDNRNNRESWTVIETKMGRHKTTTERAHIQSFSNCSSPWWCFTRTREAVARYSRQASPASVPEIIESTQLVRNGKWLSMRGASNCTCTMAVLVVRDSGNGKEKKRKETGVGSLRKISRIGEAGVRLSAEPFSRVSFVPSREAPSIRSLPVLSTTSQREACAGRLPQYRKNLYFSLKASLEGNATSLSNPVVVVICKPIGNR